MQSVLRGRAPEPVETAVVSTLTYELLDAAGNSSGSIRDETVQFRSAGVGGDPSAPNRRFWRAEDLPEALLEKVRAEFEQAGARPAGKGHGPQWMAGARREPGEEPAEADSPVGALLMYYLRRQYGELLHHDPRVRQGGTDAIHKMRVATRRLRSALSSYRSTLDPEPARKLRSELRWLAGVLGEARDAQVMRHRLQAMVAAEPADLVMGPVAARVDEELLYDYRQAYGRVRGALNSERYFLALDGLEALIEDPPWTETSRQPAGKAAARMIRRDRRRLRRRVHRARGLSGEDHAAALHDARKDAKRLRYAAEVWEPVQPTEAKAMVDAAEHVQKILGEHQDSVVTRQYLRRMGASAGAAGENGFTYGRLHALEEAHAKAAEEHFAHAWKGFPSSP